MKRWIKASTDANDVVSLKYVSKFVDKWTPDDIVGELQSVHYVFECDVDDPDQVTTLFTAIDNDALPMIRKYPEVEVHLVVNSVGRAVTWRIDVHDCSRIHSVLDSVGFVTICPGYHIDRGGFEDLDARLVDYAPLMIGGKPLSRYMIKRCIDVTKNQLFR